IAGNYAGSSSRTPIGYPQDHQPAILPDLLGDGVGQRYRIKCWPKPAACNPPSLNKRREDTIDRRSRDDKRAAARAGGRHAEQIAGSVDDGTPLLVAREVKIKCNPAVDAPAAAAMPGRPERAHDPEAHQRCAP